MLDVCMGLGSRQCGVLCRSGNCGHGCGYFLLPCSPPSSLLPHAAPRQPAANLGASVKLVLRKETQETRLSSEELVATCSVICTADYCLETTQQVEEGEGERGRGRGREGTR